MICVASEHRRRISRSRVASTTSNPARCGVSAAAIAILLALSLGSASPASAVLIDNSGFTTDTDTGLDWLDLTTTQGDSVNIALANNPGWSLASENEVATLFNNAGIPTLDNSARSTDFADADNLIQLLGCTEFCGTVNALSRGISAGNTADITRPFVRVAGNSPGDAPPGPGGAAQTTSLQYNDAMGPPLAFDLTDSTAGVYLQRNSVPEPAVGSMLGLALLTLIADGRKKRSFVVR